MCEHCGTGPDCIVCDRHRAGRPVERIERRVCDDCGQPCSSWELLGRFAVCLECAEKHEQEYAR